MTLIKKIINWLINLFKKFFGKKKVTKKIKNNINNARNKRYLKGYGVNIEESSTRVFPLYLMIDSIDKKKLIEKTKLVEVNLTKIDVPNKELLIKKIESIADKLSENDISVYQNEKINEVLESVLNDKEIRIDTKEKIDLLNRNIFEIIENFDKNIQDKVEKEYQEVNFITISTLLLDETINEIKKLEDNYKKHKYNKYYYEREVEKIKERIKKLQNLRDTVKVREEIELLRKSTYTKSKDKFDLLYNDEIFLNIEKTCDDLVNKVNRKVIDIKKIKKDENKEKEEKKDKKEKEDKEEQIELLDNILKRFKDLELARKLLLLQKNKEYDINNITELYNRINSVYYEFINGEKVIFNFSRNKTKTELVKLYNEMNYLDYKLTKKEFNFIEHINFQMDDLLDCVISKKESLDSLLETKYHYEKEKHEESILVENKLKLLKEKEEEKKQVLGSPTLVKKMDNINSERK